MKREFVVFCTNWAPKAEEKVIGNQRRLMSIVFFVTKGGASVLQVNWYLKWHDNYLYWHVQYTYGDCLHNIRLYFLKPVEPKMVPPFDGQKIPLHMANCNFVVVPINIIVIMSLLSLRLYSAMKTSLTKGYISIITINVIVQYIVHCKKAVYLL